MTNNQRLANEELAEIRIRAEKATRGATPEWFVDDEYNDTVRCSWSADLIAENIPTEADANFIAHAREDIPKLLAEVEYGREKQTELLEYNRQYFAEIKRLRAEIARLEMEAMK